MRFGKNRSVPNILTGAEKPHLRQHACKIGTVRYLLGFAGFHFAGGGLKCGGCQVTTLCTETCCSCHKTLQRDGGTRQISKSRQEGARIPRFGERGPEFQESAGGGQGGEECVRVSGAQVSEDVLRVLLPSVFGAFTKTASGDYLRAGIMIASQLVSRCVLSPAVLRGHSRSRGPV